MAGKWDIFAKFVAFAVACALGLLLLANTMANRVTGGALHYSADFVNVSGLRSGDDVRAAGVRVGRVNDVSLRHGMANVEFEISKDQPVTTATHLTLRYQSLLGQRYLALAKEASSGTGQPLPNGARIPASRTDQGFDLTALLNGFEPLFATLKPEEVNQLAESIVAVLQGQGGTIESLMGETATLTNRLADQGAAVDRIVTALTPVLTDVVGRSEQVDQTLDDLRALLTKLAKEHKRIGNSLDAVSDLSEATSELMDEAREPLQQDIRSLRTFSRISVQQAAAIRQLFETLPLGTLAFARPFSSGTWLNLYMCGIGVGFGGPPISLDPPNPSYSEACSR